MDTKGILKQVTRGHYAWFAVSAAILAAGVLAVQWTIEKTDRELREHLLLSARLVAQAVNSERVATLSGSDADLCSPDYLRIKEQLAAVRSANPQCRFIYLMGRRADGTPFFLVDSEAPDSKDYSPPGQAYPDAPEGCYQVFETGRAMVEGPVSDRWGTWVTALVPLLDARGGNVPAVLAMDMDARAWRRAVFNEATWPAGLTLALLALLAVSGILARSRYRLLVDQAALRESEENFRALYESMTDIVVVATQEGRILHTNEAARQRLGYSALECASMHLLDWHPANLRAEAEVVLAAMLRGERDTCGLPLAAKDDTIIPVQTHVWHGRWDGADCLFAISKILSPEQEMQRLLESTFHHNPSPMALTSLDERRLVDVNEAFLSVTGYSREELIGRTSAELALFVDPEEQAMAVSRMRAGERISCLEFRIRRKDGALRDGVFSGEVISNQGRQYYLTAMLDVTERKQAEEARRQESERRRRESDTIAAVASSIHLSEGAVRELAVELTERAAHALPVDRVGVWFFDSDETRLVSVDSYQASSGAHGSGLILCEQEYRNEFDALKRARYVDAHDALADPRVAGYVEGYLKPNGIASMLDVAIRVEGRNLGVLCFEHVGEPRRWQQDEIAFACQLADQVALALLHRERKQAEEQIHYQLDLISALIDSLPDFVFYKNTEGIYLGCNTEFARHVGRPVSEIVGKTDYDLYAREDADAFRANDRLILEADAPRHNEEWVSYPDGRRVLVDTLKIPFRDSAGTLIGVIGISRDITARKQSEEALRESEAALRVLNATLNEAQRIAKLGSVYSKMGDEKPTWSDEVFAIIGLDPSRGVPPYEEFREWIHPDDRARLDTAIEGLFLRGESSSIEFRFIRADGTIVHLYQHIEAVGGDALQERYIIGIVQDITERKQAEEALRESEERFRHLVEEAPFGLSLMRPDRTFEFFNQQFINIFGYTLADLPDKDAWFARAYPDPDYRSRAVAAWTVDLPQNSSSGDVMVREFTVRCKDGRDKTIHFRAVPLTDGSQILSYEDITERQQALALLETAIAQSPSGILVADAPDVTIRWANAAALGIRGETDLSLTGIEVSRHASHWQTFKPDGSPYPSEQLPLSRAILQGEITRNEEVIIRHTSGEDHWVSVNAAPVRAQDNTITAGIVIFHDITDRKRVEDALRETEHTQHLLMESIDAGIVVIEPTTHVIEYVNTAAAGMFGAAPEQLTGGVCHHFLCPAAEGQCPVTDLNQEVENAERTLVRADGSRIPILKSVRKVRIQGRDRLLETFVDITERKRVEEEREKLQSQLVQAQKMESVGRLAGGVAHDFNNMLGVILGQTELALDTLDPDHSLFAKLMEVRKAAERSADLTRQLLTFARKQTVSPKVLDLNETVSGMLKMLRRLIGEDIDLVWRPCASATPLKMDPSQVDQILANLCVNARDAIGDTGRVTIETDNTVLDESYCAEHPGIVPGEYVLLAVSDNGCGMDQEVQDRIFEPFYSTKEMGKGTGLGLATVHGIVKQNNGSILVYSEVGQGTTFKIYLPRLLGKAPAALKEEPVERAVQGNETILLVEDEPAILRLTARALQSLGYTVLAASEPGEALRLAHERVGEIHLLMTDVIMPKMNGRALAKDISSLYPHLKLLFMSGYTADVIAHHGVLEEGVHFMQKPFSIKELAAKIRSVLEQG